MLEIFAGLRAADIIIPALLIYIAIMVLRISDKRLNTVRSQEQLHLYHKWHFWSHIFAVLCVSGLIFYIIERLR